MVMVEAEKGPRLLVGLLVTSLGREVVVASLATVAQNRVLALRILGKSFSQMSTPLCGQVEGLSGKPTDMVELRGLGRRGGSPRTLLCRTLGTALSNDISKRIQLTSGHSDKTGRKGQLWGGGGWHFSIPGGSGISSHRGSWP